jgi:hypothetical protein
LTRSLRVASRPASSSRTARILSTILASPVPIAARMRVSYMAVTYQLHIPSMAVTYQLHIPSTAVTCRYISVTWQLPWRHECRSPRGCEQPPDHRRGPVTWQLHISYISDRRADASSHLTTDVALIEPGFKEAVTPLVLRRALCNRQVRQRPPQLRAWQTLHTLHT